MKHEGEVWRENEAVRETEENEDVVILPSRDASLASLWLTVHATS